MLELSIEVGARENDRPAGSAPNISQLWSTLRSQSTRADGVRDALRLLSLKRYSLHIEEHQVRLLVSKAESTSPETLGNVRAYAALIISVWVRKNSRRFAGTLELVASKYCDFLQEQADLSNLYVCEAILLLGTLCAAQDCPLNVKVPCQAAVFEELTIRRDVVVHSKGLPSALAGTGYAIIGSKGSTLKSIVGALLILWSPTYGSPNLEDAWMIRGLFEFLGIWLDSLEVSKLREVDGVWTELLRGTSSEVNVVKIMAAAGIVGATTLKRSLDDHWVPVKRGLEALLTNAAIQTCEETEPEAEPDERVRHQLRCLALALSVCATLPAHEAVQSCLSRTLLRDVLGLSSFHQSVLRAAENPATMVPEVNSVLEQLEHQVNGIMFRDAARMSRVLCEQYKDLPVRHQQELEAMFWKYALELYQGQRISAMKVSDVKLYENVGLRKMVAAAFVTMVMFHSTSLKCSNRSRELAPYVLDSFSCMEHFRTFNLSDYSEIIKKSVELVSASGESSSKFAGLIPSSEEIAQCPGISQYSWMQDDIQTSRIHFYFRTLPLCVKEMDENVFEHQVAPVMFLYMSHPQVAGAIHTLFASFVSHEADLDWNEDGTLAEKLAVYYINEALKNYPEPTPLEGLIHGVRGIAEQLPAGSAATIYCMTSLVKKAIALARDDATKDEAAAQKLQSLLLHMIFVVDMQVLPHLLKEVAKMVVSLPSLEQKRRALRDAVSLVEKSNDCLRKPVVVPWLQSLAYVTAGLHSRL